MSAGIVIAGGGVAAVEAVAALRVLLGPEPRLTLVAPTERFERRAVSVTTPFGGAPPAPGLLSEIARRVAFDLRLGTLESVDAGRHAVRLRGGERLEYDKLVVATGAVPEAPFPGAIAFAGAEDAATVSAALADAGQIVFVAASASGWALPVYELALLAARARPDADVSVVTAERSPLWIFGEAAGEAIRERLVGRGIALLTGVRVLAAVDGRLELDGAEPVSADRAVALPNFVGPAFAGLPHDEDGFVPVDSFGAVTGVEDVYAAGDVTAFPLKQGGLAAQQADAVAESIAAELGAQVTPRPFRAVLRGLLLTGELPLYLRSDGAHGSSSRLDHAVVSSDALWWPPAKVAGRYLGPLLAGAPWAGDDEPVPELAEPPDAQASDGESAVELALLLAREDADKGDYEQALGALDTARTLAGGTLPDEWERMRTLWSARLEW